MTYPNNSVNPEQKLFADKPLTDPLLDLFGYAPFASKLADGISKMTPTDGLVMAIYGPWGSGKSTLIEFILSYLNEKSDSEKPIIMRFNPWWFSGHENLFRYFFAQLHTELDTNLSKALKKVGSSIQALSDILSEAPVSGAGLLKKLSRKKERDVTKAKDTIAKQLRRQNIRILIVIDDIDRLNAEEIRQLFALIKSVADFPNVIYLLAFDKKIVSNALGSIGADINDKFIEKIVQVPFEMPFIRRDSLNELFLKQIATLVGEVPSRLFNRYALGVEGYLLQLERFFNTPRDIFRLINTLIVTYPAVKGEVDTADFIAIEAIRVFRTDLYDFIRNNKVWFTTQKQATPALSPIQKTLSNEPSNIQDMINRLFPYSHPNVFGRSDSVSWRRERRICDPDGFDVYFRFSIANDAISHQEILSIIQSSNQNGDVRNFFAKADKNNIVRYHQFFSCFLDYEKEITDEGAISIIAALLDTGDAIDNIDEEVSKDSFFHIPLRVYMAQVIAELLVRVEFKSRYEKLKNMLIQATSIYLVLDVVYELGGRHGKYGSDNRPALRDKQILELEDILGLEQIVIPKLQAKLNTITEYNNKKLRNALRFWSFVDSRGPKVWVEKTLNTPTLVMEFISGFINQVGFKEFEVSDTLFLYYDVENLRDAITHYVEQGDLKDVHLQMGKIFLDVTERMVNSSK